MTMDGILDASSDDSQPAISRRSLIGTAAVVGGAGLMTFGRADLVSASGAALAEPLLAAPIDGLTYVGLDAFAFDVAGTSGTQRRLSRRSRGCSRSTPATTCMHRCRSRSARW
jgi:hypothetical protein